MTRIHQRTPTALACPLAVVLAISLTANGEAPPGPELPDQSAPRSAEQAKFDAAIKQLALPGIEINVEERCVDVESSVCLDHGLLELIACTKDTKEHESIVAIEALPRHVHTALLLLGARPGNPAARRPVDEKRTRWVEVPPRGGPVDVFLVIKNKEGKEVERPISDFIAPADEEPGFEPERAGEEPEDAKFPTHTFLFAGSVLVADGPGPRKYLSDLSGNVITIATFGDELLCLPGIHSHERGALMWQVDGTDLPAVGSKVTLRLRPRFKPEGAPKAAS